HISRQCEPCGEDPALVSFLTSPSELPSHFVQIVQRMIFFRSEAEQPVPRRIGWDMRLIDPADRKCLQYSSVHPLTLERLLCIEGTFILIDHDPVLVEGVVAVSIEFFRDRKSTRLNSSHVSISYAVFCLQKK